MPKAKENSDNRYFNFMKSIQHELEKRLGRRLSGADLAKEASPFWKRLSEAEKAEYKLEKKPREKYDSYGTPLSVLEEAERQKLKLQEDMIRGIENLISVHQTGHAWHDLEFVTIAVTEYIRTEEGVIYPAELSLVRVTLGMGLDPRQHHTIIRPPSKWPLGYEAAMQMHVSKTHRLPTNSQEEACVGTGDIQKVAEDILRFLSEDGSVASGGCSSVLPVYTLIEHLDTTRIVLDQTFNLGFIQVWGLEELLKRLYDRLFTENAGLITNSYVRDMIVNSPNSPEYHPALGCQFHRSERPNEVNYCSLNMAQRWSYMFLQALNLEKSLEVQLISGRHYPGANDCQGQLVSLPNFQRRGRDNKYQRRYDVRGYCIDDEDTQDTDADTDVDARGRAIGPKIYAAAGISSNRPRSPTPERDLGVSNTDEFPSLGGMVKRRNNQKPPNKAPPASKASLRTAANDALSLESMKNLSLKEKGAPARRGSYASARLLSQQATSAATKGRQSGLTNCADDMEASSLSSQGVGRGTRLPSNKNN